MQYLLDTLLILVIIYLAGIVLLSVVYLRVLIPEFRAKARARIGRELTEWEITYGVVRTAASWPKTLLRWAAYNLVRPWF
jgi:hypothetical protein